MDFNNNHRQVSTLSSTHNIALIQLTHEGHCLVESFIKFDSVYNNSNNKKRNCVHLYRTIKFAYRYNPVCSLIYAAFQFIF